MWSDIVRCSVPCTEWQTTNGGTQPSSEQLWSYMPTYNGGHENNNPINLASVLRLTACPMHNLSDPKYNLLFT